MIRTLDPEKHAAKRRRILVAAGECFAEKGFHATRTADICAKAGISSGSLFHYFPSKHAVVVALLEQEGRETAEEFARLAELEDPLEALLLLLDHIVALAADPEYAALALEISAQANRDEPIADLVRRNDRELRESLAGLVTRILARGQVDPGLDPATVATWLAALIDGLFARVAADPGFLPLTHGPVLRTLVTRFLRPVGTGNPGGGRG
ncbi:TetR/AcrR family transcriptional regulator [Rhizohabitans arisaemae]|uniref:TetR/AcrR family transcriptional regulator n=1 Tax=Rhizohabitans arisaemae TaxID=2720610 RepID=UPI0024B0851F|nr:TetR/AcrR family transcriptional regulator [Rhizohabitans arisaemae]